MQGSRRGSGWQAYRESQIHSPTSGERDHQGGKMNKLNEILKASLSVSGIFALLMIGIHFFNSNLGFVASSKAELSAMTQQVGAINNQVNALIADLGSLKNDSVNKVIAKYTVK